MKNFYLFMTFLFAACSVNAQTILASEDFEAGLPTGWTIQTQATDGGWIAGTATSSSSQYWGIDDNGTNIIATNDDACNCDKSADRLITPAMDLSAEGATLYFDAVFAGGTYQGVTEELTVLASSDGGTTWTDVQAIEGSGNLSWSNRGVFLGPVAGPSVMLAFQYNDGGVWSFGAAIDNFSIVVPEPNNAALTLDQPATYVLANESLDITGSITNLSGVPITAVDITWSSNGGTVYTDMMTGLNIAPFATATFTHANPLMTTLATDEVTASITTVNGTADPDMSNNSGMFTTTGVTEALPKVSVFEEATGTWCGWCPRGHVFMAQMEADNADFLGVAVHNSDPMANAAYDAGIAAYISGYPSGAVDRVLADVDPSNFQAAYDFIKTEITPGDLRITDIAADMATRELTVTVESRFVTNLATEHRFGLIITENGVTGTTASYDQTNYYSNENQDIALEGAGHNWQTDPDPVPAADMVYDHVGREVVGGFNGVAGSLPAAITAGETHSYTFTYTIPAEWNTADMHVIATLIDIDNGARIWNADGATIPNIEEGVSNEDLLASNSVDVFPNPATDISYVRVNLNEVSDVTVKVINNLGQEVYNRNLELNGDMIIPINSSNFASGVYHVNVSIDGKFISKKLVIR